MDPTKRTLRRITMADVAGAKGVFELLMGNEVAPRKEFIVEGAAALDRNRIDA
jgi:DNA gyrase subunit B